MLNFAMILPLQASKVPVLPTWFTPVWVLAIGILLGFLAVGLVLTVFFAISRIPVIGKLADERPKADIVAGVLSLAVAFGFFIWIGNRIGVESADRVYLILPSLVAGAFVGWGLVFGVWWRTFRELKSIFQEGPLLYLLVSFGGFGLLGLLTTPLVVTPVEILKSIPDSFNQQLLGNTERTVVATVEAAPEDQTGDAAPLKKFDIQYDAKSFNEVQISSDRAILIADAEKPADFLMKPARVEPGEDVRWKPGSSAAAPLPIDASRGVFIQNREIDPATVTFTFLTRPKVPEAGSIIGMGLLVSMLVLGYITIRQAMPRIAAVALSTAKNEISQLLFVVLLAIGVVVIVLSVYVPFYTMGEDIKVLKTTALTAMMILSIAQAVWAAGTSIHDEIEGRTALTVLSKPISRRSFWLGKMLGIFYVVLIMFVVLGLVLMFVTAYKPIYDARENTTDRPQWQECHLEMVTTVQPMALLALQALVIAGIAAAIAPRVPPLANMLICGSIYVVGNLTATIVQSGSERFPIIGFIGNLIAVLIPNLDSFHIEAAVDAGNPIPLVYLFSATTYAGIFGIVSLMIALLLFEDRDLA